MEYQERNEAICAAYTNGQTLSAIATTFALSEQRVRQILQKASVLKPREPRDVFLGIDVTAVTKDKLKEKSKATGKSVSRIASEAIEKDLS